MTTIPVSPNSAFFARLQTDATDLTEIIDFEYVNGQSFRWTTCNAPLTYTLSGAATVYTPFPGMFAGGLKDSNNLQVAAVNFVLQNSGSTIQNLIQNDFGQAHVKIGRVFTGTPNLGRMEIYNGTVGDFSFDRSQITGQARNLWKSLNVSWPYYSYQDNCMWRFGSFGCGVKVASITVALNSVQIGSSTTLNVLVASGYITQSYANNRFDFGRVTCTYGVNSGVVRTIRVQSGDLLTLANAFPYSDFTGMQLAIYPGCRKREITDCKSLYNNSDNFMGFPWIILQPLPRFPVRAHGKAPS